MPGERAVVARGLARSFDGRRAVDGVDLHVDRGETLALLGPNGAGKTTTVQMLNTLLAPTGGGAEVAGHDVARAPEEVRRRIGVVFQGPSLELQLSARDNLRFHARLYKVPPREAGERIAALLAEAGLAERADEAVWRFSGGMRRRLELARAVLHKPQVLFLDEPTVGLDPQARLHTWALLERIQRDERMAVLLTTHDMQEADRLADRVAIMDHGKLLVVDTPEALKDTVGRELVVLRLAARDDALAGALAALPGVEGVDWEGPEARVRVRRADQVLRAALDAAEKRGVAVRGIDLRRPTLEDVFIARTGRMLRDGP